MTSATSVTQKESNYNPFGGERQVLNAADLTYKFAAMEYDPETGAYHTLYRQYSPNLGRWLSPDPVAGDVFNPQSLDRYAYVLNNPVNLTDPLGLQGCPPHNPDCLSGFRRHDPCSDPRYAITHAECGPRSWGIPPIIIMAEVRQAAREAREESRNDCTESKSSRPKHPFGSLCPKNHKFIEEWTCKGAWKCCIPKMRAYVNSCYDRGPGHVAIEDWPWGVPVVQCCYSNSKMNVRWRQR